MRIKAGPSNRVWKKVLIINSEIKKMSNAQQTQLIGRPLLQTSYINHILFSLHVYWYFIIIIVWVLFKIMDKSKFPLYHL